jgi:hypothetical protein
MFGVGSGWSFTKPGGGYTNALRNYVVSEVIPAIGTQVQNFAGGFVGGASFGLLGSGDENSAEPRKIDFFKGNVVDDLPHITFNPRS